MKKLVILFFLVLPALWTALPARAADPRPTSPYTITVIPYYSPEKIWTKFSPFVEYLRKATGQPWELKLYHNHAAVLDGLCGSEVGFALLGPVPMGRALDRCGAGIVAVALNKDGTPYYRSVLVTADPSVDTPAALRGKRFGLFKGSTAAHIVPLKMLRSAGLLETDIVPVWLESQDRIMNAVLSREVSGAGVKDTLYQRFQDGQLRALQTSDRLPMFAIAAAPNTGPAVRRQLEQALLRLDPRKNAVDGKLMQDWDDEIRQGFIAPPPDFRPSVLRLLSVYAEISHDAR
jgi:ABC-type phosphate/phosphonate transport system substrate-binding protein